MYNFNIFSTQSKNGSGIVQNPEINYNRLIYDGNTSPSSVKTAQSSFQFQVIIQFFITDFIENNV